MAAAVSFLPLVSAIGQVVSGFMSGGAASSAGESQAAAYNYNAAVARNNAIAAENAAAANAKQQDVINKARLAQSEAGILHSGVLMEGTPLMLIEDQAAQGALETAKIKYQGQTQTQNYQTQAQLDAYNANVARSAGNTKATGAMTSGIFSGIGEVGKSLFRN